MSEFGLIYFKSAQLKLQSLPLTICAGSLENDVPGCLSRFAAIQVIWTSLRPRALLGVCVFYILIISFLKKLLFYKLCFVIGKKNVQNIFQKFYVAEVHRSETRGFFHPPPPLLPPPLPAVQLIAFKADKPFKIFNETVAAPFGKVAPL